MASRIQQIVSGALRTYREEGAVAFAKRVVLWLQGERRYYMRPVIVTQNPVVETTQETSIAELGRAQAPLAPLVSIIIPVYNALSYAQACVDSLYRMKTDLAFEVVLVDNGSAPDVGAWMRDLLRSNSTISAFRLSSNVGYGGGMNVGVRAARGEFLLLANSDTEFTDYSLDLLVQTMQRDPLIGVLSPVTNYVGEGPQVAPDAVDLSADEAQAYAAKVRNREEVIFAPERVAFFCVMMRRSIFQLLNGFDEAFQIGNFEDENMCARVRLLGLNIGIATNSFVYHHGSKTFESNAINHTQWMTYNSTLYQNRLATFSTDTSLRAHKRLIDVARGRRANPTPRFSVIMRTRNRADKLSLALNSLAMQTFHDFEVIVVNDAGEDVADLLHTYEPFFPIQYVNHRTPQYPSEASNSALRVMCGEYFIHLDDDDIVFPFHLELFNQMTIQKPEARVLYSGFSRVLMEEQGDALIPVQRMGVPFWAFNAEALLYSNYIPVHATMMHREVRDRIGWYDPDFFVLPDWDYSIRVSREYPYTPINRVTCEYRFYQSLGNIMISRREKTFGELRRMYEKHPTNQRSTQIEREKTLNLYQAQLKMMKRLREQVERGEKTERQINLEILHELVGFAATNP